jgi:hypothetical protein
VCKSGIAGWWFSSLAKTTTYSWRSIAAYRCGAAWEKVVEKVVAKLLSDEAERQALLSASQFGCRRGRLAIDAAAIMFDRAHASWREGHIADILLMDIKVAYPSMAKGRLVNLMKVWQMDGDLIWCMESFLSERMVEMVMEGYIMQRHPVEAAVQQGSPVSTILFIIYTVALIIWVEEYVSQAEWLSFVDNLGWVVNRSDVSHIVLILERCARKSIEWANGRGLQFCTAKTEAAPFTRQWGHRKHLQPKLTATIRVVSGVIQFNTQVTGWLPFWTNTHLTFREQHNRCRKKSRAAKARLGTLTTTYWSVEASIRAVQVPCIQEVALYACDLWWDPNRADRRDALQLLLNRQAMSPLGAPPTTPWGALLRDSALTPTPIILDCTQQRFAVRLADACSSKLKELHRNSSSSELMFAVFKKQNEHGRTT